MLCWGQIPSSDSAGSFSEIPTVAVAVAVSVPSLHGNLHFDSHIWDLELNCAFMAQQVLLSGRDAHPALGWLMDLEASPRSAVEARLLSQLAVNLPLQLGFGVSTVLVPSGQASGKNP